MEFNRNQYFFAGIVIVLIGVQLRMVSSYELTPEASQILARPAAVARGESPPPLSFSAAAGSLSAARKTIEPPPWLGWCLISVGSVLILHSLAMKKPD